ncbi:MAG: hypothetical protein KGY55_01450 [Candidatus Thermoplasmatota archaeon]|nr:hypothetical protein [Candidatus Thermoplasmatota archaeon]
MDVEEIGIMDRVRMRKLDDLAVIEIMHEPDSDSYQLVMGIGIERKMLTTRPRKMIRITCTRDEIPDVVNRYLDEEILPGA